MRMEAGTPLLIVCAIGFQAPAEPPKATTPV